MANKYLIIKAKEMHCLAVSILMIVNVLKKDNKLSQETIGEHLGLINDSSDSYNSGIKVDITKISNLLIKNGVNIKVEYIKSNTLEEWQYIDLIEETINKGKHLICTLASRVLYKDVDTMYGHALLLVDYTKRTVIAIDPDSDSKSPEEFSKEEIYNASRQQDGGLIVFS